MDTVEYRRGLLLGMAVGIAAGVVILMVLFKKKVLDMHFDERQERARGVAFKYGFFALAGSMLVLGGVDVAVHWCDMMLGMCLCACIGVTVFAAIAIWKDAYLGLYEKPWKVLVLFAVLAVFNLGVAVTHLLDGGLVENGIVTFRAANMLAGATMLAVMAIYGIRCAVRREAEDGE